MSGKVGGSVAAKYTIDEWVGKAQAEIGSPKEAANQLGGPAVVLSDGRRVTLPNFRPYVEKGAELMDRTMPGWWRNIDTSALDLKNENMCVLGQTWTHYAQGEKLSGAVARVRYEGSNFRKFYRVLFGGSFASEDRESRKTSSEHGFNILGSDARKVNYQLRWNKTDEAWSLMWEQLTTTWLEKIRSLQEDTLTEEGAARLYDEAIVAGKSHAQALLAVAQAGASV